MAIMMKRHSGMMSVDLSDINGLIYRLQNAREETMMELMKVSRDWGSDTEGVYKAGISYAHGFKSHPRHRNKGTFFDVQFTKDGNKNIRISVGHSSFIAKFLEVGTTEHEVNPVINGKMRSMFVSGINGNHALSKAFKSQRDELGRMLEITINSILSKK